MALNWKYGTVYTLHRTSGSIQNELQNVKTAEKLKCLTGHQLSKQTLNLRIHSCRSKYLIFMYSLDGFIRNSSVFNHINLL